MTKLSKYKQLNSLYQELYGDKGGLVGIGTEHIQVRPDEFKEIVPVGCEVRTIHRSACRLDLEATVEGINFITLI